MHEAAAQLNFTQGLFLARTGGAQGNQGAYQAGHHRSLPRIHRFAQHPGNQPPGKNAEVSFAQPLGSGGRRRGGVDRAGIGC
ncbi:MAG: hypothetical protein DYG91_06440 [Chloroflexi bacterium CFX7]|nr:MAG: hypothetical protein EDM76_03015 [bacterium]MCE7928126.1 hypothetical protein [Chloroflexi bacterium CFX7]RIL02920.1 MAG: hypothetical protein DCC78_05620 [bacterium]